MTNLTTSHAQNQNKATTLNKFKDKLPMGTNAYMGTGVSYEIQHGITECFLHALLSTPRSTGPMNVLYFKRERKIRCGFGWAEKWGGFGRN